MTWTTIKGTTIWIQQRGRKHFIYWPNFVIRKEED